MRGMTVEEFLKIKPQIQAELDKAILKAAEQYPESFRHWAIGLRQVPLSEEAKD